jgi:hypothetical protein
MTNVKKHDNNSQAMHFLKIAYKKLKVTSPYEKLGRASLWDWCKPHGDLKPNYIHA